MAEILHAQV